MPAGAQAKQKETESVKKSVAVCPPGSVQIGDHIVCLFQKNMTIKYEFLKDTNMALERAMKYRTPGKRGKFPQIPDHEYLELQGWLQSTKDNLSFESERLNTRCKTHIRQAIDAIEYALELL